MSKIKYISKCILYSCIIINILSIVIYYIGATALFRRGIDLVRTVEFILIFGQTFIITCLSILIIFISKNKRISLLFYVLLIIIHIYISNPSAKPTFPTLICYAFLRKGRLGSIGSSLLTYFSQFPVV